MSSPRFLIFLFTFIVGVYVLSIIRDWYFLFPWLDIPLHLLGGLFIGLLAIWLSGRLFVFFGEWSRLQKFLLVLGVVCLVGVFWEFFEFGLDWLYTIGIVGFKSQLSVADTIGDLFLDILGGLFALISHWLFPPSANRPTRLRL